MCVTWYSFFFLKETYVFKRQSSRQDKTGLPSWVHPRKPYQPSWLDGDRRDRQAGETGALPGFPGLWPVQQAFPGAKGA